ncbi:PKD domain-containing protein [Chryseobacterium sp. ES2]|uniref:PKD domain-containing protein n=1 Tax=Chryseobacterium metallicongregator TaxID=3073042 RepID=A0ABU1E6W3_9FLAO|nr:PKD domain-containing protein [Chryseobacterium sp. ES2]MDR4953577.1 PKD domain-containing protein [Chryseobacterium sp. ES2]
MNTKLDNVTTQYRKFNDNQALTEGQLNEFIDYFEDQDRLSRTRLSGVGVVCGFKSEYVELEISPSLTEKMSRPGDIDIEIPLDTIMITQGAGVTTDGDLITLRQIEGKKSVAVIDFDAKNYRYYRNYVDVLGYEHFRIGGQQIPLLELFTTQEYTQLVNEGANAADFKQVREIYNSLNDKIVILYLESYSNDETPCQDADCDNNGAEQVANLKVLLADSASVSELITKGDAKDAIYKQHNTYEKLFDSLPNIEAKRVILDALVKTAPQLKTKFHGAISTVAELSDGFTSIAGAFNINMNLGGQTLFDKLNPLLTSTSPGLEDYQYRYDLLKDLIDTYNEIKGLILHLNAECCPDIASFPKHLMLGPVGAKQELGKYIPLRHSFYNSPITTNDDENYERVVMLANRFVQKVNGFQTYIGRIKITPSNMNVRLGNKAIPYYYNVDKSLLAQWNFEKTKTDRATYNLSYHTANLAGEDFIQNPLNYNIDDNDFYRIEGHLGMPYKTALQNINDLKTQYGLAFDVIALVLEKGGKPGSEPPIREKTVSIDELRKQLISISSDVSNRTLNSQNTLLNISKLDEQLRLLNQAEFSKEGSSDGVTVVKQDPKKDDVVSELLSEFLERKSGLEHRAGVEPGGTFALIYYSEDENQVLADFSLPYLCCSKKDPAFLSLPANKLCQKDAPVLMTIVPLDGQVKAFVNGAPIPAVTQSGGQSFFDPGLVNAAYFGQTITFTVNDDPVEAQMVVYAQPNVSVTTGTVSYDAPTMDENANNPDATVEFNVTGDFTGVTFTWNFDDGTPIVHNEAPTNKKVHVYKLVAGQEKTFNPTLTVTNANGCSTVYKLAPLKLKGQSTIACLSGMRVVIQYRDDVDQGHVCNDATFNLKGNGIVIGGNNPYPGFIGNIHLSNTGGSQDRGNHKPGTPALSRYNEIVITQAEAKQMASLSSDGFVEFSLECALPVNNRPPTGCHQDVAYTEIFLANATVPIYFGYPNGNFLRINPCTGVTK